MKVYFAAYHAGFELKEKLIPFVRDIGHEVEDMGAHELNTEGGYSGFVTLTAQTALAVVGVLVLMSFAFLLPTSFVHGETIIWNQTYPGYSGRGVGNNVIRNPNFSVMYRTQVLDGSGATVACGSTVPAGTELQFVFGEHTRADTSWFVTGGTFDSPYGSWINNLAPPTLTRMCDEGSTIGARKGHRANGLYIVDPPVKTLSGITGAECDSTAGGGRTCTATINTPVTAVFNFAETQSVMYGIYWNARRGGCQRTARALNTISWSGGGPSFTQITVPAASSTCSITVDEGANETPEKPTLSVTLTAQGGQCIVGSPVNIKMTATDPDGDSLRYLVDWDGNGTVDQIVPSTGYVESGVSQTTNRTYTISGSKTVRVRTQDSRGSLSAWSSLTFNCEEEKGEEDNTITTIITSDNGDGLVAGSASDLVIRVIPSLVAFNASTKVHWSGENMSSCFVVGSNGDGVGDDKWNTRESPIGGNTSSPISGRTTYTLTCLDALGVSFEKTAQVLIVPVWEEF